MEIFEKAAKIKLRFSTPQGQLSVEELWDYGLPSLDAIAKAVNKLLRDEGEETFLPSTTNKPATQNDLRLEILKHIIAVRVQEQEDRKTRSERLAKLAQLKELAANKANEQLASKSLEDIHKEIEKMEAALV